MPNHEEAELECKNNCLHFFEKWEETYHADMVRVDFNKNFEGINSEIVDKFIDDLTSNTNWKVYMWADGDEVQFIYEEEI